MICFSLCECASGPVTVFSNRLKMWTDASLPKDRWANVQGHNFNSLCFCWEKHTNVLLRGFELRSWKATALHVFHVSSLQHNWVAHYPVFCWTRWWLIESSWDSGVSNQGMQGCGPSGTEFETPIQRLSRPQQVLDLLCICFQLGGSYRPMKWWSVWR